MKTFEEYWETAKDNGYVLPRNVAANAWAVREKIADAREAELRAEVERLRAENEALRQKLAQHTDEMLWLADPAIEYGKVTALKQ